MNSQVEKAYNFHNIQIDSSIINSEQILNILIQLSNVIEDGIEGDVVELGCYVGESSKYIKKLLDIYKSDKNFIVYDSFEGLPPLSEYEINTGWQPYTLKTTKEVLIQNFQKNNLNPPKIVKSWFKDIQEKDLPEKISFAFLDGDFYDSIYDSLVQIYDKMSDGGVIMFHDYKRPDLPGVESAIRDFLRYKNLNNNVIEICNQLGMYTVVNNSIKNRFKEKQTEKMTLVTGLWNIGRDNLVEGWNRNFEEHYLSNFKKFLQIPTNLIIFGDKNLQKFVEENKSHDNVQFILKDLNWFMGNFYDKIQSIRTDPNWYNQKGWLSESTQARLDMYNPLVMQKMFLLNDARIMDSFDSKQMFWLDAGITNTVHPGYFTHDLVFNKIHKYVNKFSFVCFPYEADGEIHGFKYDEMCRISSKKIEKVARGGFFGGPKDTISEAMNIYYGLMDDTLSRGFMGTEESLFSIMVYKYPQQFDYFEIESNGLFGKFFEDLKNDQLKVKNETTRIEKNKNMDLNKSSLYVITFNSPDQFESLIESFYEYDPNFIDKPKKYLLNNSTDRSTDFLYDQLCEEFDFEQLRFPENLGICGGRQYIAEHFDKSDSDFMFFFEDDMFFYDGDDTICKNGFNRYVDNLYLNSLEITKNEGLDFLKLNFTEFYGDNSTQWSWYNVPQDVRNERWPDYNRLPERGFDPNAPRTKFNEIKSYKSIPYARGEVYYCNWPQVVTKSGNRKMFLDTTWAHPHEQTWMSHIFQETLKKNIDPGILLISPIDHNRFDHYDAKLRKES